MNRPFSPLKGIISADDVTARRVWKHPNPAEHFVRRHLPPNAGGQRQFDAKKAAAAFGAVHGDLSAMGQADRADDRES